jgi:hypothetical protein
MIPWNVLKTYPKLIKTLLLDWRQSSARALGLLNQSNATHKSLTSIPPYPRGIAIDLCAGSADAENTLKCYKKAGEGGLARFLATKLCGVREPRK